MMYVRVSVMYVRVSVRVLKCDGVEGGSIRVACAGVTDNPRGGGDCLVSAHRPLARLGSILMFTGALS